jgi:hypothetical protein
MAIIIILNILPCKVQDSGPVVVLRTVRNAVYLFIYLFIYLSVVNITTISIAQAVALIYRTFNEWWIGKAMRESGRSLIYCTAPLFDWRDWHKPRKAYRTRWPSGLTLLFRTVKVTNSNLGLETGHHDWGFSWFSSVHSGKCWSVIW